MNIERFGVWINELDLIPSGYGVAWLSTWSHRAFCVRLPFNKLAGSLRAFLIEFKRPCEDDPVMQAYNLGRAMGFNDGNSHGYKVGLSHRAIVESMQHADL